LKLYDIPKRLSYPDYNEVGFFQRFFRLQFELFGISEQLPLHLTHPL